MIIVLMFAFFSGQWLTVVDVDECWCHGEMFFKRKFSMYLTPVCSALSTVYVLVCAIEFELFVFMSVHRIHLIICLSVCRNPTNLIFPQSQFIISYYSMFWGSFTSDLNFTTSTAIVLELVLTTIAPPRATTRRWKSSQF